MHSIRIPNLFDFQKHLGCLLFSYRKFMFVVGSLELSEVA